MRIACPPALARVLLCLHEAGYEAYLVGGSLRDILLGRVPHDWDVATSALPEETLSVFADWRTIPTGLKHGTVTVLADDGGETLPIEITTYRIDGDYLDARHPSEVSFTRSLDEDLARRDFTVGAMAWSPYAGGDAPVDLFDGQGDLARRVIRCVGNPETRFREDALRILRAYRFAAELSFSIDPETRAGARVCAHLLDRISAERICAELSRTLVGENAAAALTMMEEDGILAQIVPDAVCPPPELLSALPRETAVRLCALFGALSPAHTEKLLTEMRFPGQTARRVSAALSLLALPIEAHNPELAVRRLLRTGGETAVRDMLALRGARGEDTSALCAALDRVISRGDCTTVAGLALGGTDLAEFGIPRGPEIGRTLSLLLDAVIADPTRNTRERLTELLGALHPDAQKEKHDDIG